MGTQPLLISVGSAGQKGNDDSYFAQAVGDGRYALFVSDARNLSDSDGNGRSTFLHDTVDGWTAVVDIGPDGQAANSSSEWRGLGVQNPTDPLDVAFSSQGFGTGFNLYYRDVEAGTTVLIAEDISKFDYPLPVNGETWHYGHFAFSPDGKFLSFASSNDSLVPNDSNNRTDIFLKNLETGDVSRVSTAADGEQSDGHSNPTNEEYIDAMYQNVLDRLPDLGGYDFWVGGMVNDGLTREDILIAFTKSDENVDRTAPDLDDGVWVV